LLFGSSAARSVFAIASDTISTTTWLTVLIVVLPKVLVTE
jgi:hypothetical protein